MTRTSTCLQFLEDRPSLGIQLFFKALQGTLQEHSDQELSQKSKVNVTHQQIAVLRLWIQEESMSGHRQLDPSKLLERYKTKQLELYNDAKYNRGNGKSFWRPKLDSKLLMEFLPTEQPIFETAKATQKKNLQPIFFRHNYTKLRDHRFTTIRRSDRYKVGQSLFIKSPEQEFVVKVLHKDKKTLDEIPDTILLPDTDCETRDKAIDLLNSFYRRPITSTEKLTLLVLERFEQKVTGGNSPGATSSSRQKSTGGNHGTNIVDRGQLSNLSLPLENNRGQLPTLDESRPWASNANLEDRGQLDRLSPGRYFSKALGVTGNIRLKKSRKSKQQGGKIYVREYFFFWQDGKRREISLPTDVSRYQEKMNKLQLEPTGDYQN